MLQDCLKSELKNYFPHNREQETTLLKPDQVAMLFKVSKVTIHQWTKQGILKAYHINSRKYYKKGEILEALESQKKYNRKIL